MGLCINCKYHTEKEEDFIHRHRKFPGNHVCEHPDYKVIDFVTGEVTLANCYVKNSYESCLLYEEIEDDTQEDTSNEDGTTNDTPDLPSGDDTGDSTDGDSNGD